jgi:hypothetical protein
VGNQQIAAAGPSGTRPLGVMLISGFYVFGAVVLLIAMFLNPAEVSAAIAQRHGLSPDVGVAVLPAVALLGLAIAYGLYTLSRWGLVLTVVYLAYFAAVSLFAGALSWSAGGQPLEPVALGNFTWSALVVIYLLLNRARFRA